MEVMHGYYDITFHPLVNLVPAMAIYFMLNQSTALAIAMTSNAETGFAFHLRKNVMDILTAEMSRMKQIVLIGNVHVVQVCGNFSVTK